MNVVKQEMARDYVAENDPIEDVMIGRPDCPFFYQMLVYPDCISIKVFQDRDVTNKPVKQFVRVNTPGLARAMSHTLHRKLKALMNPNLGAWDKKNILMEL